MTSRWLLPGVVPGLLSCTTCQLRACGAVACPNSTPANSQKNIPFLETSSPAWLVPRGQSYTGMGLCAHALRLMRAWAGGTLATLEFFHPSQSAGQSKGQTQSAPPALPMCCNPGAQEHWLQNLTLHLSLSSIRGINFCACISLVNACIASQATHRHCIPNASALLQLCVLGAKRLNT